MSDGCLHSKERIRTVSGMPASIFLSGLRIYDILCGLLPSLSGSVHTEQVLQEPPVSYFQTQFGFVPCYVNSRLTSQGIPVSCEVDIYGTLSEFIGQVVSNDIVTLLDINNSVPKDMYKESIEGKFDYTLKDTFMGFHCGNTASSKLSFCEMKYQMIMARSLPIEVTNGTLEGDIKPGDITFYRLQSTADNKLRAYIAHGEVLPVATRSFGAIGVFAIPEMGRFYRHVLIEGGFPHHGAVAFGHFGKALFEVFKYIGVPVEEIGYNQPAGVRYPTENPWG